MKTTVVIITHKINILAAVDKVLIMADGASKPLARVTKSCDAYWDHVSSSTPARAFRSSRIAR